MYGSIRFYVGKKTIVLNEHTYTLGELTADILNISPEEYRGMKEILLRAEEKMEQYRSTKALEHWEAAMTRCWCWTECSVHILCSGVSSRSHVC